MQLGSAIDSTTLRLKTRHRVARLLVRMSVFMSAHRELPWLEFLGATRGCWITRIDREVLSLGLAHKGIFVGISANRKG